MNMIFIENWWNFYNIGGFIDELKLFFGWESLFCVIEDNLNNN